MNHIKKKKYWKKDRQIKNTLLTNGDMSLHLIDAIIALQLSALDEDSFSSVATNFFFSIGQLYLEAVVSFDTVLGAMFATKRGLEFGIVRVKKWSLATLVNLSVVCFLVQVEDVVFFSFLSCLDDGLEDILFVSCKHVEPCCNSRFDLFVDFDDAGDFDFDFRVLFLGGGDSIYCSFWLLIYFLW